jgi:hypothetical protein
VANAESKPLKEYIGILMETYGSDAKADYAVDDGVSLPGLDVNMDKTIKVI